MKRRKSEAPTPADVVDGLLDAAGPELVLVGGQALAIWLGLYGLRERTPDVPAVSNDVDFLAQAPADRKPVARLANVIHGKAVYPSARALTALVGQAVLDVSDEEYLNVDVIFKVVGIDGHSIRKRAVTVQPAGRPAFLVMHPLDVLRSRVANLHEIPAKQNEKGKAQLALAIDVGRAFLHEQSRAIDPAATAQGRSPIQHYVSAIEKMATEDAGRKIAQRHALHVADAIDPHLIPPGPFWTKRWPELKKLMSPAYVASLPPDPKNRARSKKL